MVVWKHLDLGGNERRSSQAADPSFNKSEVEIQLLTDASCTTSCCLLRIHFLQLVGVLLVALFSELIPDVPVPVEVQVC